MGSVRGFRCQHCRGEILAQGQAGRPDWTPAILCCGASLLPLPPEALLEELVAGILARGRVARCPRCDARVRLVVHPAGAITCCLCQMEFEMGARETAVPAGAAGGRMPLDR